MIVKKWLFHPRSSSFYLILLLWVRNYGHAVVAA